RSGIGRAFAAMDFRFRRSARCFRTGTRAYPSAVCEERTTKSELKRHAARWVAPQLASGVVAPQSQPHFGGCSFVAPRQKPTAAQQMPTQFVNGTLVKVARRDSKRRLRYPHWCRGAFSNLRAEHWGKGASTA